MGAEKKTGSNCITKHLGPKVKRDGKEKKDRLNTEITGDRDFEAPDSPTANELAVIRAHQLSNIISSSSRPPSLSIPNDELSLAAYPLPP